MTPHSQNSLAFASTVLFNILKYSLCIFCHDIKITELGTRDNSRENVTLFLKRDKYYFVALSLKTNTLRKLHLDM